MNSICKIMAVAAVAIAASLSASAETPASAGGDAAAQKPIPTLHCEFKAMSACTPDGDCKEGNEVAGIKVPGASFDQLSAARRISAMRWSAWASGDGRRGDSAIVDRKTG